MPHHATRQHGSAGLIVCAQYLKGRVLYFFDGGLASGSHPLAPQKADKLQQATLYTLCGALSMAGDY